MMSSGFENGDIGLEYTKEDLAEAKRQIDSILHKLRQTVKTLQSKEEPGRFRPQITLAQRRIAALTLAVLLIEREQAALSGSIYIPTPGP